jgi:hypothetical protein
VAGHWHDENKHFPGIPLPNLTTNFLNLFHILHWKEDLSIQVA